VQHLIPRVIFQGVFRCHIAKPTCIVTILVIPANNLPSSARIVQHLQYVQPVLFVRRLRQKMVNVPPPIPCLLAVPAPPLPLSALKAISAMPTVRVNHIKPAYLPSPLISPTNVHHIPIVLTSNLLPASVTRMVRRIVSRAIPIRKASTTEKPPDELSTNVSSITNARYITLCRRLLLSVSMKIPVQISIANPKSKTTFLLPLLFVVLRPALVIILFIVPLSLFGPLL